jgi:hypothetical protein
MARPDVAPDEVIGFAENGVASRLPRDEPRPGQHQDATAETTSATATHPTLATAELHDQLNSYGGDPSGASLSRTAGASEARATAKPTAATALIVMFVCRPQTSLGGGRALVD